MDRIFDFGNIERQENTMYRTWDEFRKALSEGKFKYYETDKAMQETFLKVFNDMFEINKQKEQYSKRFKELRESGLFLLRGARLNNSNPVDYSRFLPLSKFINEDNRFSPKGVEWLYLAIGETKSIAENCALKECRAQSGMTFGLCNFKLDAVFDELRLVDLTISNNRSYEEINGFLECFCQTVSKLSVEQSMKKGRIILPKEEVVKEVIKIWATSLYAKMMSSCIFEPVETGDKELMYSPFQCMAYYFQRCGFEGIIYGSTVCPEAKDIVLFDKKYAIPFGDIEYKIIQ